MLEFSSDTEMGRVRGLADELFEHVLYDEEPLFVSDEATLWGISMSDVDEVLERCRKYYGGADLTGGDAAAPALETPTLAG